MPTPYGHSLSRPIVRRAPNTTVDLHHAGGEFALLGNLLLGRLSDTIGRHGALVGSLALGTLAYGGFTMANGAVTLYRAAAAFGFYYGTFASLYPAVVGDYFGRLHAGTLTGFGFAMGSLPSAIGPVAMGLIADRTAMAAIAVCPFLLATPPPVVSPAPTARSAALGDTPG
jgi:MFS family permease